MTCQIGTYNCRGLRNSKSRLAIFEWLKSKNLDVILLQETQSTEQDEVSWRKEWEGEMYFSHGKRDSRGVMVLINKNNNIEKSECISGTDGRELFIKTKICGIELMIVNIYAPNDDEPMFYERVFEKVIEYNHSNVIIGGDYNLVFDIDKDKSGGCATTNVKAQNSVKKYMDLLEMCDVWRVKHPELREYTWRRRKPSLIQCRLDFFLLSQSMVNMVQNTKIGTSFRSDHSIVTLTINLDKVQRGPGYWKLNCALLKEKEYVDMIKATVRECEYCYEELEDKALLWETMKMKFRSVSIKYSIERSRKSKKREKELDSQIHQLETQEFLSEEEESELCNARKMLNSLIDEKVEGQKIRSRAKLYQDDEKGTKYFLNLEKNRQSKKIISQLKDDTENIVYEQDKIREEVEKYYAKLYKEGKSCNTMTLKEAFFKSLDKCLVEEDMLSCEGELLRTEILAALKQTKNNKSPGIDGIPVEFYKMFWHDISGHMLEALNYTYRKGEMSVNHRRGVISLLPKKDRDTTYVKNWRPITLLCCDYKLASKVIANRLKPFLPKLIDADQCGFVRNRYIGQNIDVLTQIIEYSERNNVPGLILSVDYQKAFDFLSWQFIENVLHKYGFGEMLIKWVKLFYTNISAVVNVNGVFTNPFHIEVGVKQGDPLSPYLFILCAEVLAEYIRKDENI